MARRSNRLLRFFLLMLFLFVVPGMVGCGSDDDDDDDDFRPPPGNRAPIAAAGADRTVPTGTEITLDGSASSDPDDDPLSFLWEIILRPADSSALLSDPNAVRPTITPDVSGEYRISLVVNDGEAASEPDLVVVTAVPPGANSTPVAVARADDRVHVNTLVSLDASGSFDPDGDPLSFEWAIISQPITSFVSLSGVFTPTASFFPPVVGNYEILLTVSDGRGGIATTAVFITAVPASENISPIADAGPDLSVAPGTVVQLNGAASRDPDGEIRRFDWEFISRPEGSFAVISPANIEAPLFTPDVSGTYRILLTVTDSRGGTATDELVVLVLPPGANRPPAADAGPNRIVRVGFPVTLDGRGSRDPEGEALVFSWTISRPGGSVAVLTGAATATPSFVPDVRGDYVLQLTVSDPQGAIGTDSVLIMVL